MMFGQVSLAVMSCLITAMKLGIVKRVGATQNRGDLGASLGAKISIRGKIRALKM